MRKKSGIFIHSLFRTGSTYLWDKFRQSDDFYCYYEPFHQELAFLGTENSDRWKSEDAVSMGHPLLNREYMHEYRRLLRPGQIGIPFFKKSFSFDDFCNKGSNLAQKKYIDFLLANNDQKIPLLQFNRSALRVGWFKNNYPEVFHVCLIRNPRQQFCSFINLYEKRNLDIFLLMNLLIASVNMRKHYAFNELASCQPLFEYHAADFYQEEMFYRYLLPFYSYEEQYFIHYSIWFAALLENLAYADMFLNIDLLSYSDIYREQVSRCLEDVTGTMLDFSDASIATTEIFCLPEARAAEIENDVRTMLLKILDEKQIQKLAERFDADNQNVENSSLKTWLDLRKRTLVSVDVGKTLIAKKEAVLKKLSPQFVELHKTVKSLKKKIPMDVLHIIKEGFVARQEAGFQKFSSQVTESKKLEKPFKKHLLFDVSHTISEFKTLAKYHASERMKLKALNDLLSIASGKSQLRRGLMEIFRVIYYTRLVKSPSPTEEMALLRGGMRLTGLQKKSQPGLPLVTVVTVVLNEVKNLERTIISILQQSYPNIEVIVIDGGSTQPTLDVIEKFKDKIDYWQSEPDRGIFDAMSKGIELANGEWINFLNCGDCFYRKDTVQTVFSQNYKGADFIYGHTDFQGGDFSGVVKAWSFDILWKTMIFTHQSLFSKTEVLKKRRFDTNFRICADYDLIYNSWSSGLKFHNSDTVIASFHPGFSDISRSRMAWEKWRVVRKHRNDLQFHLFYLQLFLRRLFRDIINRLSNWLNKRKK